LVITFKDLKINVVCAYIRNKNEDCMDYIHGNRYSEVALLH